VTLGRNVRKEDHAVGNNATPIIYIGSIGQNLYVVEVRESILHDAECKRSDTDVSSKRRDTTRVKNRFSSTYT
jgi:hypothetical protein